MKRLLLLLACVFVAVPAAAQPAASTAPPPAPHADHAVAKPLQLSFTSTSAFGVTHAKFFNQLVGAGLDYRFTPRFAFGAAFAYANLKGKAGRVSNVLPEVTTAYRVPLNGETVGMPLCFSLGFLPKNGPTLRLGGGFDVSATDSLSFELIPLEPMVWITRDRPEVSLDAHASLRIAF